MPSRLQQAIEWLWYHTSPKHPLVTLLSPLSHLFSGLAKQRKQRLLQQQQSLSVPIVVVGNISVGGTGKTPLLLYLLALLQREGYQPAVVSRGYGGKQHPKPVLVHAESDPQQVGDEPVLIARRLTVPIAVHVQRVQAINLIQQQYPNCDVILSDDGLQHYRMGRDIEIALIDGRRRFGNQQLLPVGPLREPIERLQTCDFVLVNGPESQGYHETVQVTAHHLYRLQQPSVQYPLNSLQGQPVNLVTGIGNPQRFIDTCVAQGIAIAQQRLFPDHYLFRKQDIMFNNDNPVLMTEKDAVKCLAFAGERHWCLAVQAQPSPTFETNFLNRLKEVCDEKAITGYSGMSRHEG